MVNTILIHISPYSSSSSVEGTIINGGRRFPHRRAGDSWMLGPHGALVPSRRRGEQWRRGDVGGLVSTCARCPRHRFHERESEEEDHRFHEREPEEEDHTRMSLRPTIWPIPNSKELSAEEDRIDGRTLVMFSGAALLRQFALTANVAHQPGRRVNGVAPPHD
jgi:hypothetical protein